MQDKRIKRINGLLKKEVGNIILREISLPDCLTTIIEVDTAPGITDAKICISVFPEKKGGEVIKILNKEIFDIQQKINKKLKMRPIPKIAFVLDKRVEKTGRIEKLLEELKNN